MSTYVTITQTIELFDYLKLVSNSFNTYILVSFQWHDRFIHAKIFQQRNSSQDPNTKCQCRDFRLDQKEKESKSHGYY